MTTRYYDPAKYHTFYNENEDTVYIRAKSGQTLIVEGTSSGNNPAGSNTQVQFNNAGVLGASPNLTFDGTTLTSTFSGNLTGSVSGVGSNTQVVYNNAGTLSGSANLTFNGTTLTSAGFSGPLLSNDIRTISTDGALFANSTNSYIGCDSDENASSIYLGSNKTVAEIQALSQDYTLSTINSGLSFKTVDCFGNTFFTVPSNGSNPTNGIYTSTDGQTWTFSNISDNDTWKRCCNSGGLNFVFGTLVFGTGSNKLCYSSDLITWNNATLPSSIHWTGIALSSNLSTNYYVCVGASVNYTGNLTDTGNNTVAYSANGITWSTVAIATQEWSSVCYSAKLKMFVAVSSGLSLSNTTIHSYSYDGLTWTSGTCVSGNWQKVVYSELLGTFVACGLAGKMMYSDDGISWNSGSVPNANNFTGLAWNETYRIFVAVANTGTSRMIYSSDGVNFSNVPTGYNKAWGSVISNSSGLFVVVGDFAGNDNCAYSELLPEFTSDIKVGTFTKTTIDVYGADLNVRTNNVYLERGTIRSFNTNPSYSNVEGALILYGGIGIYNSTDAVSSSSGGTITSSGGVGIAKKLFVGGISTFENTTASTSNTTGSIKTSGGIGISNTTEANSKTDGGTITTGGGCAIAKKLYVGGQGNFENIVDIRSTSSTVASNIIKGSLAIQSTWDSQNVANGGSLTVGGGLAVASTIYCSEINALTYSSPSGAFRLLSLISNSGTQSMTGYSTENLKYTTSVYDNLIDISYSNGVFTANKTMIVLINYGFRSNSGNEISVWIQKNTSGDRYAPQTTAGVGAIIASGACILTLANTNTFSVKFYNINSFTNTYSDSGASAIQIYSLN